ncbi:MAG TPA: ATP-binding protein [Solirubrobacteraceae bacterium]|nr:ATP-binding protein [Solirubrobacteraceae bacterium]
MTPNADNVRVELDARPHSPSVVRAALGGLGEAEELAPEVLDDLRTAVSEACNNVVLHAYPDGGGRMRVEVTVSEDGVDVEVADRGRGIRRLKAPPQGHMGVGLFVMAALAERAEFTERAGGGTIVRLRFRRGRGPASHRDGGEPLASRGPGGAPTDDGQEAAGAPTADGAQRTSEPTAHGPQRASEPTADGDRAHPSGRRGEVLVRISPVTLVDRVLGSVLRALAAVERFPVDRAADMADVAEAVGALGRAAGASELRFSLQAARPELVLTARGFPSGSLRSDGAAHGLAVLSGMANELRTESSPGADSLRLRLGDRARGDAAVAGAGRDPVWRGPPAGNQNP